MGLGYSGEASTSTRKAKLWPPAEKVEVTWDHSWVKRVWVQLPRGLSFLFVTVNPRPKFPSSPLVDFHKANLDVSRADPTSVHRRSQKIWFPEQVPKPERLGATPDDVTPTASYPLV